MWKSWQVGLRLLGGSRQRESLQDRCGAHRGRARRWRWWGSRRREPPCRREGYREYRCGRAGCGRWVRICSCCDRGHRYCGRSCAQAARRKSQRKSQQKYEQKPRARRLRAARASRHRARRASSAAQSSPEPGEDLPAVSAGSSDPEDPPPIRDGSTTARPKAPEVVAASEPAIPCGVDSQKVTHQGSPSSACLSQWRSSRIASGREGLCRVRCEFCGAWCWPAKRRGPLRGRRRHRLRPFPGR